MSGEQLFSAARLAKLPAEDRQWLYGQLSSDERSSLVELLSRDSGADTESAADSGRLGFPSSEERVSRASPWQITQALLDEPEWMLALLLSRRNWPWGDEYLDSMDASRREKLHALASTVGNSAREMTYKAVVTALAERIASVLSEAAEQKTLEIGVARLMDVRPIDD